MSVNYGHFADAVCMCACLNRKMLFFISYVMINVDLYVKRAKIVVSSYRAKSA